MAESALRFQTRSGAVVDARRRAIDKRDGRGGGDRRGCPFAVGIGPARDIRRMAVSGGGEGATEDYGGIRNPQGLGHHGDDDDDVAMFASNRSIGNRTELNSLSLSLSLSLSPHQQTTCPLSWTSKEREKCESKGRECQNSTHEISVVRATSCWFVNFGRRHDIKAVPRVYIRD